ncbi:MAG: nucleotidyl transferase AbiEii/AbiGii toxin family protein [Candidatus Lokiarchaeota archaeon]|nr:nucleotidyl transferase AbiEii/AbiGii toxin family protein [Candidatus Lokiarchaeota archaeon]
MKTDLEKSLKSRIKNLSVEKNVSTIVLWQNLVLERFLVRIANSKYADYFVLKGGMLLSKLIEIGRETKDLDFAVHGISNNLNIIQNIIKEIISIPIHDGFAFDDLNVKEMSHPLMHYLGARVNMKALFGKIRFKVIVDLGFGDLINPDAYVLPLSGNNKESLFESSIKINCYPIDFIFAEKLHSIIERGRDNSRMKDFHDLYLLIHQKNNEFDDKFMLIIKKVFEHRNSKLVLPLNFNENDLLDFQNQWKRHLNGLKYNHKFPGKIKDVVFIINKWLEKQSINEIIQS